MLWKLLIHMVCVARCAETQAVHVQATWLLSEFCDKGNIDRALCGGRFRDEACKPQMVRRDSITLCHRMLQAVCNPQSHHGLGFGDRPGRSEMPTSLSVIFSSCLSANKAGCERQVPPVRHCVVDTVQYQASIGKGLKYLQVPIYRCLLDIANGMVYLHSMGVVHGMPLSSVQCLWNPLSLALLPCSS